MIEVAEKGTYFSTSWRRGGAVSSKIWTQCRAAEVNSVDDDCEVVEPGSAVSALPPRYTKQPNKLYQQTVFKGWQ